MRARVSKRLQSRRIVRAACLTLGWYTSAWSQMPRHVDDTWAAHQHTQSWATDKLARSPRHSAWISMPYHGHILNAWIDYPQVRGKVPVVLVLHEVFGLTDSTRNTADEIAAMGYITITPDMLSGYGPDGGGTRSFASSRVTSDTVTSIPNADVDATLDAWVDYADRLPTSSGRVALVGLSWGGGAAFRYATTRRKDVKACFVFYDVGPPKMMQGPQSARGDDVFAVQAIRLPVYGFYGSRDTRVMASLEATRTAMAKAGKAYDPVVYERASHAFMRVGEDPANDNPADAAAVKSSLARLKYLLVQTFK